MYKNNFKSADAQDVQQWLLEEKNILVLVDYIYECDDTPYCYKIYKLGENGKPERWPINGARYKLDEHGNEVEIIETVGWSDFKKSYQDFHTYSEAIESGINEALEMIDKKQE